VASTLHLSREKTVERGHDMVIGNTKRKRGMERADERQNQRHIKTHGSGSREPLLPVANNGLSAVLNTLASMPNIVTVQLYFDM
jgi:hypothetical protein